ncbi:hypothetical protein GOBAR_DD15706 [Gossypium barbadense]|nr:hypothetical protein GOBAR_DD15706 [Gossypium barbadense]
MTKLFYKFPISSNPIKFIQMELLDDDDVETMVALYCSLGRLNTKPIQLFAELVDEDPVENYDGKLHIHLVIIETDALGKDGSNNNGCSDHECEDFSDPNLDNVPDDMNDEGLNDGNDHALLLENLSRGIIIRNDPGAHMSIVDPNAAHASEFPERVQVAGTSYIYLEVSAMGDTKIFWASYMHFCTYDVRPPGRSSGVEAYMRSLNCTCILSYFLSDDHTDAENEAQIRKSDESGVRACRDSYKEIVGCRSGIQPRSYGVDLLNR